MNALVAGVAYDEIDLEDAIGIASFHVASGRVPPAAGWVDGPGLRDREIGAINEAFAEGFF